jgi:hypothetical protein
MKEERAEKGLPEPADGAMPNLGNMAPNAGMPLVPKLA